jgi:hypothetical protein
MVHEGNNRTKGSLVQHSVYQVVYTIPLLECFVKDLLPLLCAYFLQSFGSVQ